MLTFREFIRLPIEEKVKRYVELSDGDKFLARISDYGPSKNRKIIHSTKKENIEASERALHELEEALKQGKVNLIENRGGVETYFLKGWKA